MVKNKVKKRLSRQGERFLYLSTLGPTFPSSLPWDQRSLRLDLGTNVPSEARQRSERMLKDLSILNLDSNPGRLYAEFVSYPSVCHGFDPTIAYVTYIQLIFNHS